MDLKQRAQTLAPTLVQWRRHLHAHPEVSFAETETAGYIRGVLSELGIEHSNPVGNSTVGVIAGRRPGKTVAIRADIDALPIAEETGLPFASNRPGAMHACGHDGHTAILLGVARLLQQNPDFPGTIKLLFQEAEEKPPGGARALVDAGVLDGVDHVIGLHLWSDLPTGQAGIRSGPALASADFFEVTVTGKGGHGAYPHETIDSVVVAAAFVMNLQTVVSRKVNPTQPAVVSVGTIQGGFAPNVIAPEIKLSGTVRAFDEATRQLMVREIEQTLKATCAIYGATYAYNYVRGYPSLVNHPLETEVFRQTARETLGEAGLSDQSLQMGGEDFASYLQAVPGAFLWLGCRNEAVGAVYPHHHPKFTIDEAALPHGVEVLLRTAFRLLET